MGPKKRVLFLNQFYWPDAAPTAALLDDVARKFVAEGWDVTVLCGRSAYAKSDDTERPPVTIVSVPGFPYTRRAVGRLLSWCTFLLLAILRSFTIPKCDLVVAMTSPPGIGWAGVFQKLFRASKFWIWEMDVYPDIALALGESQDSFFGNLMSRIFLTMRRNADGILVLGPCMKERLEAHNLPPEALHIAQNWADGTAITPLPLPEPAPLTVLYSGNLGMAHDSDTIAGVVQRMRDCEHVQFVFSGGGVRRASIENLCATEHIANVRFSGYASASGFLENLGACHLGLVTLRPECVGTVVPSKVYSFLAAGRPFLYIGPQNATPAHIAAMGCGWSFENGDVDGIVALLEDLRRNPATVEHAAAEARRLFEIHFDREIGTEQVFAVMNEAMMASPVGVTAAPAKSLESQ